MAQAANYNFRMGLTKTLPQRCARFAPRAAAIIGTLPVGSFERRQLELRLAALQPPLLRLVDSLISSTAPPGGLQAVLD
jgi:hypothetical protein